MRKITLTDSITEDDKDYMLAECDEIEWRVQQLRDCIKYGSLELAHGWARDIADEANTQEDELRMRIKAREL